MYPGGFTTRVTPDSSAEALRASPQIRRVRARSVSLVSLIKKKKEKYRIRQVCTLATLGQKQQPRSGLARFPRRVSLWPQALWGVSHAWPDAARLAASVSVPHCLSLGVGRTSLQSDHVASVYGLQWHKGNRSPSARVCLRSPAVPMTLGSSKSIHVELTTASNPSL